MTTKPKKQPDPTPAANATTTQAPEKAAFQTLSDRDYLFVLGEVTWLMGRSPRHRHLFVADFDWLVAPALVLKQARLFRQTKPPAAADAASPPPPSQTEGTPMAFVSWAFVSDEVEARLKSGIIRLQPTDWRSGPHPWIIDVVAPFGAADQAVAQVFKDVFGGKAIPVAGAKVAPEAGVAPAPKTA